MRHAFSDAPLYLSAMMTRTCVELCFVCFVVHVYETQDIGRTGHLTHNLLLQLVCPLLLLMTPTCSIVQN